MLNLNNSSFTGGSFFPRETDPVNQLQNDLQENLGDINVEEQRKNPTPEFDARLQQIGNKVINRIFSKGNTPRNVLEYVFLMFSDRNLSARLRDMKASLTNARSAVPIVDSFSRSLGMNYATLGSARSSAVMSSELDVRLSFAYQGMYFPMRNAHASYSIHIDKREIIQESIQYMLDNNFISQEDANFLGENLELLFAEASRNHAFIGTQLNQMSAVIEEQDRYTQDLVRIKQNQQIQFANQPNINNANNQQPAG